MDKTLTYLSTSSWGLNINSKKKKMHKEGKSTSLGAIPTKLT